ncbi:MAG: prolyl oligopeptidase family serine peptidase [Bacteroidales bacterium]|nr:prolyl oligopeptidase family serine peptidase [Bacteroidales bacterium]
MKRILILLSFLAASFLTLSAQEFTHHTMKHQGLQREYYLYIPDNLLPSRPLVIMLHGYGGTAEGYRPEMAQKAKEHGFALVVPDGWPSPVTGKKGWNVRYPKQEGQKSDDEAFVIALTKKLQKEYGFKPEKTFLSGMSNGGEMCYIFAWRHPEFFRAIASVAGLTMAWLPEENKLPSKTVPFMEIHGTGDHTSEWTGDPTGEFGWGAYLAVPLAVGNIVTMNRCSYEKVTELPLLDPSKPTRQVILHQYLGVEGSSEVRLYEVVDGKHSWHLDDIDTCEEIWKFFEQYL